MGCIPVPILSDALIARSLQHAKVLACPPTGKRCFVWPATVGRALASLDADGWCVIGGVEDVRSHGPRWRAVLNLDTGEVRIDRE